MLHYYRQYMFSQSIYLKCTIKLATLQPASSFICCSSQYVSCSHMCYVLHNPQRIQQISVVLSFLQVWSLPILLHPSPCRVPSWGSSSFSLGLAPLLALACWLLCPSRRLAGCHPTETLVREKEAYTLYVTTESLTCFLVSHSLICTSSIIVSDIKLNKELWRLDVNGSCTYECWRCSETSNWSNWCETLLCETPVVPAIDSIAIWQACRVMGCLCEITFSVVEFKECFRQNIFRREMIDLYPYSFLWAVHTPPQLSFTVVKPAVCRVHYWLCTSTVCVDS